MDKRSRHSEILRILKAEHRVDNVPLAERLDVSEITIRRDLQEMEAAGWLRRMHGGAIHTTGRARDHPFDVRMRSRLPAKMAIAAAAARLVDGDDAIALDVGSTVALMVDRLVGIPNLTIVTASLRVAWDVANSKALLRPLRLILAGGLVTDNELSVIGQSATEDIRKLRVDTTFLGVGGVSATAGLTDFNLADAEVKRGLVDSARQVVVLADSSKLDTEQFVQVAELRDVDLLITDTDAPPEVIDELRAAGLDVTLVKPAVGERDQPTRWGGNTSVLAETAAFVTSAPR